MDIDVLLFEGFDELDVVGPFEVLASARDLGAMISIALVGVDGADPVTAAHGLRVLPDGAAGDRRPDLYVVPGGGWDTRGPFGARAEVERGVLPGKLAEWHAGGILLASLRQGNRDGPPRGAEGRDARPARPWARRRSYISAS